MKDYADSWHSYTVFTLINMSPEMSFALLFEHLWMKSVFILSIVTPTLTQSSSFVLFDLLKYVISCH